MSKISKDRVAELLMKLVEIEDPEKSEKEVMIEKAICLRTFCDYVVSCTYGDVVLIIAMLRDYVRMLDDIQGDNIEYQAYYRKKFMGIADRLSAQIDYDYDKALKKCLKKKEKESKNDVGEDALVLALKSQQKPTKKKGDEQGREAERDEADAKGDRAEH